MNFELSEGQSAPSFLNKAKKLSKRLLKLAKSNGDNISILNLSQAQDTIAKINGFPDWHALDAYIKKIDNPSVVDTFESINTNISLSDNEIIKLKISDDIFYDEKDNKYISHILIFAQQVSKKDWEKTIKSVLSIIDFPVKTKRHGASLFYQEIKEEVKSKQIEYNVFNLIEDLKISTSELEKFIIIKDVKKELISKNNLFLTISTKNDNFMSLNNHNNFVKKILEKNNDPLYFKQVKVIDKCFQEKLNLLEYSFIPNDYFEKNEITKNLGKILYFFDFLKSDNISFYGVYDIAEKKFGYKLIASDDLIQKKTIEFENYLDAIHKVDYVQDVPLSTNYDFNIKDTFSDYYLNESIEGVNMFNVDLNNIENVNLRAGYRKNRANVGVIWGRPGAGKSTLSNFFALESVLNTENKAIIIDSYPLPKILKLPIVSQKLQEWKISQNDILPNPLIIPLNFYKLNEDKKILILDNMANAVINLLIDEYEFNNSKKDELKSMLRDYLKVCFEDRFIYKFNSNFYKGFDFNLEEIDFFKENKNKNFEDVVQDLVKKKWYSAAYKVRFFLAPTLKDLSKFFINLKENSNDNDLKNLIEKHYSKLFLLNYHSSAEDELKENVKFYLGNHSKQILYVDLSDLKRNMQNFYKYVLVNRCVCFQEEGQEQEDYYLGDMFLNNFNMLMNFLNSLSWSIKSNFIINTQDIDVIEKWSYLLNFVFVDSQSFDAYSKYVQSSFLINLNLNSIRKIKEKNWIFKRLIYIPKLDNQLEVKTTQLIFNVPKNLIE